MRNAIVALVVSAITLVAALFGCNTDFDPNGTVSDIEKIKKAASIPQQ